MRRLAGFYSYQVVFVLSLPLLSRAASLARVRLALLFSGFRRPPIAGGCAPNLAWASRMLGLAAGQLFCHVIFPFDPLCLCPLFRSGRALIVGLKPPPFLG